MGIKDEETEYEELSSVDALVFILLTEPNAVKATDYGTIREQ